MTDSSKRTVDSRMIAQAFGQRHHNVLRAIDLVLCQCPAAAVHFRFGQHVVTAGLGGTRYVRHAVIDQIGFMLLAMSLPSTMREKALTFAIGLSELKEF